MRELKEYIPEGIFDTQVSDADDLLNKEICIAAVLMLTGLKRTLNTSSRLDEAMKSRKISFEPKSGYLYIGDNLHNRILYLSWDRIRKRSMR